MDEEASAGPSSGQIQTINKKIQNVSQSKSRSKRNKKKKKKFTNIVSNSGDGIATFGIHGDVIQYHITEEPPKKDFVSILKKDLRVKYLEKSRLQNIPGLDEDRFIDDHYVDLKLVQVFEKEHENKEANLKEIFETLKGNTCKSGIHFEGELGYGKTTLMWKIARDWANQEPYLSHFDLLFVIPLRALEFSKTINSFITEQWLSKIEDENVWDKVKLQRVLLLFDGFDELKEHNRSKILEDIKIYKEIPNFVIVVTSREGIVLPQILISDFQKVSIRGFANDAVNFFLENFFGDVMGQKVFEKIEKAMKKSQFVTKLRCNPLYITFFCIILQGNPNYSLPATYTELIKDLVTSLVHRHIKKKLKKPNELNKINLFDKHGNPPIVNNFIEELENFGEYTYQKIYESNSNIGILLSSKEIQKLLKSVVEIGFVVRSSMYVDEDETYEPVHLFILEFLRSFYFYHLFLKNREEFFQKFQDLIQNIGIYFGAPIIISFIFGLLGKDVIDVIKEIPSKLFFGASSSLLSCMHKENPMHFEDILSLLENCNNATVPFEINISNQSSKSNMISFPKSEITPLYGVVEVHHGQNQKDPSIIKFSDFPSCPYEDISFSFHCSKDEKCHGCCISEASNSLKEVLGKKPQSIKIHSQCHFTVNSMISFLRENSSDFQSLTLDCLTLESVNIKQLSVILLNFKVEILIFHSGQLTDTNSYSGSIKPLLTSLSQSGCQLKLLAFIDVNLQINFKNLLNEVKKSKLMSFSLEYEFFKDSVFICLSEILPQNPFRMFNIRLKNVKVNAKDLQEFSLSSLLLYNCKIKKIDLLHLLTKGKIGHLQVDLAVFNQMENILCKLGKVHVELILKMEEIWTSMENKKKVFSVVEKFLVQRGIFTLSLEMNFRSRIYLEQIEFIFDCIQGVVDKLQQNCGCFSLNLCVLCSPEEPNQRIVDRKEINKFAKVIGKFSTFTERYYLHGVKMYVMQESKGRYSIIMYKLEEQIRKDSLYPIRFFSGDPSSNAACLQIGGIGFDPSLISGILPGLILLEKGP